MGRVIDLMEQVLIESVITWSKQAGGMTGWNSF